MRHEYRQSQEECADHNDERPGLRRLFFPLGTGPCGNAHKGEPGNNQGAFAEWAPLHEVQSLSAKVAQPDEFRCSDIPFRQGMSLRFEPDFKFVIGAEDREDLRLRLGLCVGKRQGSIQSLR